MTGGPAALEVLARRLDIIGKALVVAAALAFVWAVGFTQGVDGLIDGLVIAGVGFLLPAVAILWVAWIVRGAAPLESSGALPYAPTQERESTPVLVRNYAFAILIVVIAAAIRLWLLPYIGGTAPFATFFLAVALAAGVGGMGPAIVATALSVPAMLWVFQTVPPRPANTTPELLGLALFVAIALGIAGITSALRLTQAQVARLRSELGRALASLDESEARYRALADQDGRMIRLSDETGATTFVNESWIAFTGRAREDELGDGWLLRLHPEDRERVAAILEAARERREPCTLEFRLRFHDGEYHRLADHGEPRSAPDARFAGFVDTCRDLGASTAASGVERPAPTAESAAAPSAGAGPVR